MLRKLKAVYFALLSLASINSSSAMDSVEVFAQKYQHTSSKEERLQLCVEALNHKVIRNGLKESSLKSFFGANNVHESDSPRTATVYLSDQWGWRLFFSIDEAGEISQISLTNMDPKHEPSFSPLSRDVVNDFIKRYRAAKTERARFRICLDAIDTGVVRDGAPLSDLKEVFGESWREEYIPARGHFASIPFSRDRKGWRLCFYFSGKFLISNYVTNSDTKVYPY